MSAPIPGPWEIREHSDEKVRGAYGIFSPVHDSPVVSSVWARNIDEHDATIYLMAAAPDLLEALKGLLNALPSATTHPAIKAARAAIAKAEGST